MGLIKHIRIGYSVNSSSDHSLVFIPSDETWTDYLAGGDSDYFGWENFRLVSPDLKLKYLATNLYNSIVGKIGKDAAKTVAESWSGVGLDAKHGIDHQSRIIFPFDWEGKCADRAFFDAFKAYMLRPDIAIVGGNDNESNCNRDYKAAVNRELIGSKNWVCRPEKKHWVLFGRDTGNKIRISFDGKVTPTRIHKPEAPELVDLKITDWCDKGCKWCYQDSNTQGKHADFDVICDLIDDLAKSKVFEVALGGGEPTAHPQFIDILKEFRAQGIVPNFTTKSIEWLKDDTKSNSIIELMGSFAYSISSAQEAEAFSALFDKKYEDNNWSYKTKYSFNYALGTADRNEFKALVGVCLKKNITLNILGYKGKGRANGFTPHDNHCWLDDVVNTYNQLYPNQKGHRYIKLGVDTMVAKQYEAQIKAKHISEVFYDVTEGKFSMYIDAVQGLVGPSSYSDLELCYMDMANSITEYFSKY